MMMMMMMVYWPAVICGDVGNVDGEGGVVALPRDDVQKYICGVRVFNLFILYKC